MFKKFPLNIIICGPTQDAALANTMSGHQKGASYGAFTIGFPFEWTAPNGTKGSVYLFIHALHSLKFF